MVSQKSISDQLKKIGVNQHAWGQAELKQLPEILIPDEEIYECVNGTYEGGFALLVATDIRVLLIDKKPFNYLTVEDLRFDMINEIDYNHRLLGMAYVDISTGSRELKFRSLNQPRLRKLIGHVQRCMAESKKKEANHQEDQNQHLEQINERLQSYLMMQHLHQQELQQELQAKKDSAHINTPEPPKPSPELSDYLFAQGLLAQHQKEHPDFVPEQVSQETPAEANSSPEELYAEGMKEVFGKWEQDNAGQATTAPVPVQSTDEDQSDHGLFDLNPLRIAYSKLPLALRNRKFGRPSFHMHSHAEPPKPQQQPQTQTG